MHRTQTYHSNQPGFPNNFTKHKCNNPLKSLFTVRFL
uniref:Uncharacterized protein n=1 Tax=Anguilla anguilla TaxID=7936 RepID=A0A0E9PL99_ANGAN